MKCILLWFIKCNHTQLRANTHCISQRLFGLNIAKKRRNTPSVILLIRILRTIFKPKYDHETNDHCCNELGLHQLL